MGLFGFRAFAASVLLTAQPAFAHSNEHGLDARNFDTTVAPCTDFFAYANGGWLKSNPIPAAYSSWGLDNEIEQRNLAMLKRIVEDAAAHPGVAGTTSQKIGDFYAAAMDADAIDRAGLLPIQAQLDAIAALRTPRDIANFIMQWQIQGRDVLFDFEAQPDLKNSSTDIAYAGQGGLGLPDRDYYLRDDAKSKKLRKAYHKHIARMLDLLGDSKPKMQADWVLALETRLAQASLDRVALRDPSNSYHIFSLDQADAKTPHFSWITFFHKAGRDDIQQFSLAQPDFFAASDAALAAVPVAHWRAYLRWRLIDADAPYLSKSLVKANFDFHGGTLRGARQNLPRWKRAIRSADHAIGELLGQAYVAHVFSAQAKQRALILVDNLKSAMRTRIGNLDWMSAQTKSAADAKLDTLTAKIGYPDQWRDYSALTITRAGWLDNVRAARAFEARRQFAKLGHRVDRSEWDMTPQTVNAYYNPMGNEIAFPAAILQPPFFDATVDDAINYGAIGAVIGHEMTHAFDDEGSRFDARGNLSDWWTPSDRAAFDARTSKLVAQFNSYVPIDALHINGKLTLGENIADLGGLLVAYDAFKLTAQAKAAVKIDGLTPDQRFFLAYAQSWRIAQRSAQLRLQLQSNEHAPAKYRVNGPLRNVPAFATAFGCKQADTLQNTANARVSIW